MMGLSQGLSRAWIFFAAGSEVKGNFPTLLQERKHRQVHHHFPFDTGTVLGCLDYGMWGNRLYLVHKDKGLEGPIHLVTMPTPQMFTDACSSTPGPQGKLGNLFTYDILQLIKVPRPLHPPSASSLWSPWPRQGAVTECTTRESLPTGIPLGHERALCAT